MPRPRHRRGWPDSPARRRADRTLLSVVIGLSALTAATGLTAASPGRPGEHTAAEPATLDRDGPPGFTGIASWYGRQFEGRTTACGLRYDPGQPTAAHRHLPCGTRLELHHGGRSVMVTVTDRGPFVPGRILDLSRAAFAELATPGAGLIRVRARVVDPTRAS